MLPPVLQCTVPLYHLCNNLKTAPGLLPVHGALECCRGIHKPKWHSGKFEFTPRGLKRCLCGWSLLSTGICKNLLFKSIFVRNFASLTSSIRSSILGMVASYGIWGCNLIQISIIHRQPQGAIGLPDRNNWGGPGAI